MLASTLASRPRGEGPSRTSGSAPDDHTIVEGRGPRHTQAIRSPYNRSSRVKILLWTSLLTLLLLTLRPLVVRSAFSSNNGLAGSPGGSSGSIWGRWSAEAGGEGSSGVPSLRPNLGRDGGKGRGGKGRAQETGEGTRGLGEGLGGARRSRAHHAALLESSEGGRGGGARSRGKGARGSTSTANSYGQRGEDGFDEDSGSGAQGHRGAGGDGPVEWGVEGSSLKRDSRKGRHGVAPGKAGLRKVELEKAGQASDSQELLPGWDPAPGKFLLGFCFEGGLTNRLICMKRSLLLALLLNRTLIIPSLDPCVRAWEKAVSADLMIDVPHLRKCVHSSAIWAGPAPQPGWNSSSDETVPLDEGAEASALGSPGEGPAEVELSGVLSLQEYLRMKQIKRLKVDTLLCGPRGKYCPTPGGMCSGQGHIAFPRQTRFFNKWRVHYTPEEIARVSAFTASNSVVSVGDTFYARVTDVPVDRQSMASFFGSPCKILVKPAEKAFRKAASFISSAVGEEPYAALHLRRGDFSWYCTLGGAHRCTFWSVQQVAHCTGEAMEKSGLRHLFLATNGNARVRRALGNLLWQRNITMHVLQPKVGWNISGAEFRRRINLQNGVSARTADIVEKIICAKSRQLFYEPASSFSLHIQQLRSSFGQRSESDQRICKGHRPWFRPKPWRSKESNKSTGSSTSTLLSRQKHATGRSRLSQRSAHKRTDHSPDYQLDAHKDSN